MGHGIAAQEFMPPAAELEPHDQGVKGAALVIAESDDGRSRRNPLFEGGLELSGRQLPDRDVDGLGQVLVLEVGFVADIDEHGPVSVDEPFDVSRVQQLFFIGESGKTTAIVQISIAAQHGIPLVGPFLVAPDEKVAIKTDLREIVAEL